MAANKIASPAFKTFTSPATASVRKAAAAGAAADSGLGVGLSATAKGAYSFKLTSSFTGSSAPVSTTVDWGDGTRTESAAAAGQQDSTHEYAKLGAYTITQTVTDRSGNTSRNSLTVSTAGSAYHAYGPTRLLDTRTQAKVQPYTSTRLQIAGNGDIPAGVTAVVLNVTVTNTGSAGHITAYADGDTRPETSNLNFTQGQTVPNLVIVPVGANGYVDLYNGGWNAVDLIADVTGYFSNTGGSGYATVNPARLVDTRNGTGTAKGQVAGYGTFPVQISGNGGVPASGVKAVALNVTVTNPKDDGHLSVFPSGQSAPTSSNLNFRGGQTIANAVIVPVGPDGRIQVRNGSWAAADVIVDVVGYYGDSATAAYLPIAPTRLLDTREYFPVSGQDYIPLPLSDGAPEYIAWALNTTVTNTKDDGHLTVSPDPNTWAAYENDTAYKPAKPNVSSLNWKAGQTVPNLVQANPGSTGVVDFWNGGWADTDMIIDLFGVYTTG